MSAPAVALRLSESLLWAVHRRTLDSLEAGMRRALRDRWTRQESFFLRQARESLLRLTLREATQPVPPPSGFSSAIIDAALEVLDKFSDAGNAKLIDKAIASAFICGAEYVARETGFQLSFSLKSPRAQAYLATKSMERLGPDIDATTKSALRKVITRGYEEQWSIKRLTREIQSAFSGFRRKRAELITVTELGEAYSHGSLMQARDMENSGTPMQKMWAIAPGPCPTCEMNPPAGWISINALFPSGHDRPLAHPACRCALMVRATPLG